MPTGYTAQLKEMKYDVRRWLKESAIRAMGVCVMFRDAGNLSQQEMEAQLAREAEKDDYYIKELKRARERLAKAETLTPKGWQDEYEADLARAQRDYEKRVQEHNREKEAHIAALGEVERIAKLAKGKGEVIVNTLSFAQEQIQSGLQFDYGHAPYREEVLDQDLASYKAASLNKALRDVAYYTEEAKKNDARQVDRLSAYRDFCKFVDSAK
jgi:hypothetical protein